MHEGEMSTLLGMKGMPSTAEAIGLKRDLELLAYTQSRLCVYGLSSYEAVKILKEAKKPGRKVDSSRALSQSCLYR